MKTLAIRLEDEQHARLNILAKLSGESVTDVIRSAVERQLDSMATNPELSAKAEELTATIEREAAEQHAAIAQLFGTKPAARGRAKSS
ncbi:MAG: hypothetical protein Q7T56_19625 [Nocardioidaceae bacterium]|nr:hypothetical protein [Nocardioidaceae bacterium]